MKVDFTTYLKVRINQLKSSLPNNARFYRDKVLSAFGEELSKSFEGFNVVAFEGKDKIIVNKDEVDYEVLITAENSQIKVSALPLRSYKQTQFDSSESIIVETPLYEELNYGKNQERSLTKVDLMQGLMDHALFVLNSNPSSNEGACTTKLYELMAVGRVVPKEIIELILANDFYMELGYFGQLGINLNSGVQLDIQFEKSYSNFNWSIKGVTCIWHVKSSDGFVRFECIREVEIKNTNNLVTLFRDYVDVEYIKGATLKVKIYDLNTVNALEQIVGEDLSGIPAGFGMGADYYGFEPDHRLEMDFDKSADLIKASIAEPQISIDDILEGRLGTIKQNDSSYERMRKHVDTISKMFVK